MSTLFKYYIHSLIHKTLHTINLFPVNRQSFYFTTEPEDATVPPGSNVELKCNARHAKARPQYKWVLNGSELVLRRRAPLPRISDGTSSGDGNLLIRNISHLAYGMYQCVAKIFGQAIISRRASVRMSCECNSLFHSKYKTPI